MCKNSFQSLKELICSSEYIIVELNHDDDEIMPMLIIFYAKAVVLSIYFIFRFIYIFIHKLKELCFIKKSVILNLDRV